MKNREFNRHRFLASCIVLFLWPVVSLAQSSSFNGKVRDASTKEPLIGVNVVIQNLADSTVRGVSTDVNGTFNIQNLKEGRYKTELSYLGYINKSFFININGQLRMDTLLMNEDVKMLNEAVVKEDVMPVKQMEDTTEYNADAYKTNPDADGTDLVKKMPGIQMRDGKVYAQGEEVRRITVDGQEFFGEDALNALRNLPAEIIGKVQVFDRQNDQSQFTGFNDGNTTKTLNIVTKTGKTDGQFGKVYGGYGTNNHYTGGFNTNLFYGKRRITLIGMSNNINQQNFSNDDLLGALSVNRSQGGGGHRGPRTGTNPADFQVGEQAGINTAHSVGVNYIDQWGSKIKVNASYFTNGMRNITDQTIQRAYYLTESGNQLYKEGNGSESNNINHRVNLRMEITLDSNNSIIYTPRFSFQGNRASNFLDGRTQLNSFTSNTTSTNSFRESSGFNYSHDLLLRHKFKKEGRTISLGNDLGYGANSGFNNLLAQNYRYTELGDTSESLIDQFANNSRNNSSHGLRLMYTEPMTKDLQLVLNYTPSWSKNEGLTETNQFNPITGMYTQFDSLLSNDLISRTQIQQGGLGIRYRLGKWMIFSTLNYQNSQLLADQKIPSAFEVNKRFNAILQSGFIRYQPNLKHQVRIFFRSTTNLPSGSQLQNRVDNSNPLLLSAGNPELNQAYAHRLGVRYNFTNPTKGRTFFFSINGNYQNDYIATESFLAPVDTVYKGVSLNSGAQLNRPVNLDQFATGSAFASYGIPVKYIKSNLNLNVGMNYSQIPGLINGQLNFTRAIAMNVSAVISSNISEYIDFSVSYAADVNRVRNSFQPNLNNDYVFHAGSANITWLPKNGLVLGSQASYTSYVGLGETFNTSFFIWNASMGYKFMKNRAADIRLVVFDILGQNNSLARSVNEMYVEDVQNRVLTRYALLTFTYTFRNFNAVKG